MIRTALTTDKPTNKQRLERRDLLGRWGLILPAGLMIFTFMALPMLVMALISVLESGNFGGVKWGEHSGDAHQKFILERDLSDRLIVNTDYLSIFSRSFSLSAVTTVLTLLLGFPSALYVALQPPKRRQILMFLVSIPFWTNLLVRIYSWILPLRNGGWGQQRVFYADMKSDPAVTTSAALTSRFRPNQICSQASTTLRDRVWTKLKK